MRYFTARESSFMALFACMFVPFQPKSTNEIFQSELAQRLFGEFEKKPQQVVLAMLQMVSGKKVKSRSKEVKEVAKCLLSWAQSQHEFWHKVRKKTAAKRRR